MADFSLDKVKEQCFELVLSVMPLSQIIFVVLMMVVFQQISLPSSSSVVDVFIHTNLKEIFDLSEGLVWQSTVITMALALFLALFNTWLLKYGLRKSFNASGLSNRLDSWFQSAADSVNGLSSNNLEPIQASVSEELEKRIKKYRAKRLFCELALSMFACIAYGSIFLASDALRNGYQFGISLLDISISFITLLVGLVLHRGSIHYAVAKVIPLQMYISALNGKLVFFIDVDF